MFGGDRPQVEVGRLTLMIWFQYVFGNLTLEHCWFHQCKLAWLSLLRRNPHHQAIHLGKRNRSRYTHEEHPYLNLACSIMFPPILSSATVIVVPCFALPVELKAGKSKLPLFLQTATCQHMPCTSVNILPQARNPRPSSAFLLS